MSEEHEEGTGPDLAPALINALDALKESLTEACAEPFGPDPSDVTWFGSVWACPVGTCDWTHREPSAVSSTDTAEAERVRRILTGHLDGHATKTPMAVVEALVTRMTDWPSHCSEWIAGADPENPDMCPEYATPGTDKCALHRNPERELISQGWLPPAQASALRADVHRLTMEAYARPLTIGRLHGLIKATDPVAYVAYPPVGGAWVSGPGAEGQGVIWRCRRCNTKHAGTVSSCLGCTHNVLDAGHWEPAEDRRGFLGDGHPDQRFTVEFIDRSALPPAESRWQPGFSQDGSEVIWRCGRCHRAHGGPMPVCLSCGCGVLDPGHWVKPGPLPTVDAPEEHTEETGRP